MVNYWVRLLFGAWLVRGSFDYEDCLRLVAKNSSLSRGFSARRCKSAEKGPAMAGQTYTHENSKSWRFYLIKNNVPSRQPLLQLFNPSAVF
jgi:hypothetical protein